jgi:CTP:molybdopterin cytidylyltransferase MocA
LTIVAGLLLAAGAGRRLGGSKARVELAGQTLLERGTALLRAGGCSPVFVVLGSEFEALEPDVGDAVAVHARDWAEGLGSSLRAGLQALEPTDARACVITLVDQPLIGAEAIRRLIAVPGNPHAVVATYEGAPGHPVLLGRQAWSAVAETARGDVGAKPWLDAHRGSVTTAVCDGTGSCRDIDTQDDLAAVRRLV